jgi:hypothetical protein
MGRHVLQSARCDAVRAGMCFSLHDVYAARADMCFSLHDVYAARTGMCFSLHDVTQSEQTCASVCTM